MSTQTTTKRKVTRIVYDRPPLKKGTFILFTLAGGALGFLLALLLNWLYFGLGDANANADTFPAVFVTNECMEWFFVLTALGLLGGAAIGWGYKRELGAHHEEVELPPMQRRRSTSTALVRVDYGRRW